MTTVEHPLPERKNLREIPRQCKTEQEVSAFVEVCFQEEDISNKTMRKIMENATTQIQLLRLRGAA